MTMKRLDADVGQLYPDDTREVRIDKGKRRSMQMDEFMLQNSVFSMYPNGERFPMSKVARGAFYKR